MLKQIQRIERLHQLIRLKATGSARDCAQKLEISERQLYNTLELMKDLGAPIYYVNSQRSYCYKFDVEWNCGFSLNPKVDSQIKEPHFNFFKIFLNTEILFQPRTVNLQLRSTPNILDSVGFEFK